MSCKKRHQHTLILGLIASLGAPLAHAQDAATKTLIEQGQYWQSRGDAQRAMEVWQRVLRVDAHAPEGLYGMGRTQLLLKNFDDAERYLNQLRRAHPGHRLAERLQQDIQLQRNGVQLQQARSQAQAGQADKAVSTYQAALGDKAPTGPLALEYYQTLGGTAKGWEEARGGLERLARESPDDPKISLALAQHLTYREGTRREGIQLLERLAGHATVGKQATESWRKALVWSGARAADTGLYQSYLKVHPSDEGIQARLREIQSRQQMARTATVAANDPLRKRSAEGFKALDDGDLEAAEANFRSVIEARPNDGDALGGMGILRLRQEEFAQARNYLERASQQGQAGRWKQALSSATYWSLLGQARDARSQGDLASARQSLEQAVRIDAREVTGENELADVLSETGQLDAAEAAYRRVLARQSDNPDAIRGLVGVLSQTGKSGEALQLVEKLTPGQQEKVGSLGQLRATQAMGQARTAMAQGDDNAARLALENALLNDPGNAWVRLDLARLYLKVGATREARGVMDGLLVSNPHMPEALYASALLASESGDWAGALATLDRIPEKNRTRDIAQLQRRVWVHVQADAAATLGREGQTQQARAVLAQAEPFVGQSSELLGALALAHADAGDPNRALAMVREVLARTPRPDVGLRLQYAAALLKTQQDVELAGVLRQLQDTPMSAQDRRSFEDLRKGYILRQVDALRAGGDLASAYDTLSPLLAERASDPAVVGALASLYTEHGDHAKALALYHQLLEKDPRNLQLLVPAIGAAAATKDYNYAESALAMALQLAPNDPDVLTAAGRLYRAKGQTSKAGQYFAAAVDAENRQRAQVMAASGQAAAAWYGSGSPAANPFRARAQTGGGLGSSGLMFPTSARVSYGSQGPQPVMLPAVAQAHNQYIPDPAGAARMPTMAMPHQVQAQGYPQPAPTPAGYYGAGTAQTAPSLPAATRGAAPKSGKAATTPRAPVPQMPTPVPASAPVSNYVPQPAAGYMAPVAATYGSSLPAAPTVQQAPAPLPWMASPIYAQAAQEDVPGRPRTALEELSELQGARTPTISVGVLGRARQGESGLSHLTDVQAPVEFKFGAGDGVMTLRATPTSVSAGSADSSYGTLSRFGGGPATALDMPDRLPGSQRSSGIGLGIAYETANFAADINTLPLGFSQNDVTGGVKYRMAINDQLSLTGEASRRAVTDSVLSFSGARDARTGEKWGGVTANGVRLGMTWDDGEFGTYVNGGAHALQGHNVENNYRLELSGGIYWHVIKSRSSDLTAGLNLTGMSYDKNLSYYTFGHGGYFSPQQFMSASVPFDWSQRSGRLSYQINGALGVQYFKQDAAAYFPGSASRQATAAQAASDAAAFNSQAGNTTAVYPSQSKTGIGYRLGMAMEYQLHPQLFIGGQLALDNARDYRQFTGGLYVRYALQPVNSGALALSPLKSPYTF